MVFYILYKIIIYLYSLTQMFIQCEVVYDYVYDHLYSTERGQIQVHANIYLIRS